MFKREKRIEETFKFIAKEWPDSYWISSPSEWNKLISRVYIEDNIILDNENHINCKTTITTKCNNCFRVFCKCSSDLVSTEVCCLCDEFVQPFVSNPINKKNIEKYCPEKIDLLTKETCIGCIENQPNQTAHMYDGGCMSEYC